MVESANSLSSRSAPPEFLTKLTYLVWNHHKAVRKIETVRAYTLGEYYFAEVDIVLPKDMLLHNAHDIGESLQNKLETLPEIERAFVHLDYDEYDQTIEHEGHQEYWESSKGKSPQTSIVQPLLSFSIGSLCSWEPSPLPIAIPSWKQAV